MKTFFKTFLLSILTLTVQAQNFPDSQTDGKYYEVNGAKIWTVSFGTGEPIFFIAGGPGNAHSYMRKFDSLSTTNTLVYFDGFGRGKSDTAKNVTEYSLERDVEDLEGFRRAMGFSSISILGHSYGGVVAQAYAIKYPNNVSHLVLANSFHSFLMW
jgi:proline iminopeptidase